MAGKPDKCGGGFLEGLTSLLEKLGELAEKGWVDERFATGDSDKESTVGVPRFKPFGDIVRQAAVQRIRESEALKSGVAESPGKHLGRGLAWMDPCLCEVVRVSREETDS
jgi:hypothetical protein